MLEVLIQKEKRLEQKLDEAYNLLAELEKRSVKSTDFIEIARFKRDTEKLSKLSHNLVEEWKQLQKQIESFMAESDKKLEVLIAESKELLKAE